MNDKLLRALRYLKTFLWLHRQQFKSDESFTVFLCLAMVGRIGPLAGMMAAAKCIAISMHPEKLPEFFTHLPLLHPPSTFFAITLVLVPTLIVVVSAACQSLSTRSASKLQHSLAYKLSSDFFWSSRNRELKLTRPDHQEFIRNYTTIYRIETVYLNLAATFVTVCLALAFGLAVNFVFMALLIAASIAFAASFVTTRHRKAQEVTAREAQLQQALNALISTPVQKPDASASLSEQAEQNAQVCESIAINRHSAAALRASFSDGSRFITGLANGGSLLALMSYAAIHDFTDAHEIAGFISLLFIVRFFFSCLHTLVMSALALSSDYPFLVKVRLSKESLAKNSHS